jgi:hypothetical protein
MSKARRIATVGPLRLTHPTAFGFDQAALESRHLPTVAPAHARHRVEKCSAVHPNPHRLFQWAEAGPDGARPERLAIGFPVAPIRAPAVTHAHIDQDGRLPCLLGAGLR